MNKRFHSMVRRVVFVPMFAMLFLMLLAVGLSLLGLQNMRQQLVDGYVGSARVSLNRLDMRLTQIDGAFIEYWNYSEDHAFLKKCAPGTPMERYVTYQAGAMEWMQQMTRSHQEVGGIFISYENLDRIWFRGTSDFAMHRWVENHLNSEEQDRNHWALVEVAGRPYLITVKRYGTFEGGVWLPASELLSDLRPWEEGDPAELYLRDRAGQCAAPDPWWTAALNEAEGVPAQLDGPDGSYQNYPVVLSGGAIEAGVLISRQHLLEGLPAVSKALVVLTVLSVALVPATTLWLRRKIAQPVRVLDQGMQRVGAGEMDYRIPLPDNRSYDEFERLMARFNAMTDELNELEYRLYITTIRQQRTELKYISQQIRPHFILNALNLIYTCDESEFPLVRKMVLYLTEYFRYIVNLEVDFVEVQQELRHVENYLNIQKERYLDRFDFVVEWETQVGRASIPPLILQTFVENCVKYGMKNEGKTLIYVMAGMDGEQMKLTVADVGSGFSPETLERLDTLVRTRQPQTRLDVGGQPRLGLGVGIQNAVERLDILYGGPVDIRFYNKSTGGAVVEIFLPPEPPAQSGGEREETANV